MGAGGGTGTGAEQLERNKEAAAGAVFARGVWRQEGSSAVVAIVRGALAGGQQRRHNGTAEMATLLEDRRP